MKFSLLRKVFAMSKFFLFVGCTKALFVTAAFATAGHTQILEEAYVDATWQNQHLDAVFADIQAQTDFYFTYDYDAIKDIRISGKERQAPLAGLLMYLAGEVNLHFHVKGEIIYVTEDEYSDARSTSEIVRLNLPPMAELEEIGQQEYLTVIYQRAENQVSEDIVIKGKVSNNSGDPLIGATITVKGTNTGTVTDIDGTYTIAITEADGVVLLVSYIGFKTQEIPLNGRTVIDIIMEEDLTQLSEVVVIGYGTGTKEKFNGAVSKVGNEELNDYATANFDQALAGKLAGVQILGNNKNPDENAVIQIRGLNTLTAGTNPLIVVDGNPLTEGASLSTINTQDIESISILKDAASAAIYGSRASNGVILVTTKKGQDGRLRVTYDGYTGFQQRIDKFELTDAYETAKFDYDARNYGYVSGGSGRTVNDDNATRDANGGGKRSRLQPFLQDYLDGKPGLTNTNWADEVFRNAQQQNHYLNLSGGNGKTDYSISFGYFDQDNIVIDSDYKRYTNSFKLNSEINDHIRFGISSNIAFSNTIPVGYRGWSDFTITAGPDPATAIFLMQPYYPVYNEDGSLAVALELEDNNANWDGPISGNAVATMELTDYEREAFRFFGNTFLEIEPIKNLKFKTSLGGDYSTGVEQFFSPTTLGGYRIPVANSNTMAYKEDDKRQNFITENILTFDKSAGQHSFNVLGGFSYQQEFFNKVRLESQDFTDDNIRNISGATTITATNGSSKWALESYFTRLQYDFAGRYALSASYRRDGSSRFGAETKYGDFASLSVGWTLSNEAFFPKDGLLSFAKLRYSWGQTGNNQIGNFASIALVSQDNYLDGGTLEAGAYTSTSPNADLSWETNTSSNFGVDLGILDNKILLTAEYYVSNTTDLLLSVPVPQQSGFSTSLQNIGELKNTGVELELKANHFKMGDIHFDINANFSTTQNEVLALGNGQTQIIQSNRLDFITKIGQPIAQMYAYDIIGVYRTQEQLAADPITPLAGSEVGDYVVRDVNGDGKITSDDRTELGDYNPDFIYGFGFNAAYKGFDLGVQFFGIEGRKVVDYMVYSSESGEGFFVPTQYYFDNYFTDDNPDGFFRRPDFASFSSAGRLTRSSSLAVLDADYFRLRSLQLGYTFDKSLTQKMGVQSLRLYVTGNNIFNITEYRGYNPDGIDTNSNTTQTLTRGAINSANPLTRFVAFGVNVKF